MAGEQDRRTRMVHSSVNAQPAKGGAGGSYTWGSPMDVQDYMPVGVGAGYGVVMAPQVASAPVYAQTIVAPSSPFQMDQGAFPVLGAPPTNGYTTRVSQGWGASQAVNPVSEAALRTGALGMVGQQHPRNLFAKKPYTTVRAANGELVAQAQEGMIDWNSTGISNAVMQTIVQSPQAAAHLGPYGAMAAPQVPLDVLRVQNVAAQQRYQQYTPQVMQQMTAPRPIQQPVNRC